MSDIANQLRIVLTDLITTQSEGEWDDGLIASDVEQFLPPILATVQAALDAAEAEMARAVGAERERCAALIDCGGCVDYPCCSPADCNVMIAAAIRTGAKP